MREEAGVPSLDDEYDMNGSISGGAMSSLLNRSANIAFSVSGTTTLGQDKGELQPSPMTRVSSSPGLTPTRQPNVNPALELGTVAGIVAGPADTHPVDWDLWQSVVYEGPAAVARTSSEELNQAIASGIPQAIRGVVWQVLAQSKNEELEGVYRDLVARGIEKERSSIAVASIAKSDSDQPNSASKEKESIASSASSIQSDCSTSATTATNGTTNVFDSPGYLQEANSAQAVTKLQATLLAGRKKKVKDDAVALQKLEKVIKRDLGARTSYSKYVMSAGLQDGLFGVCKAYALFDEAVGYAQGMNFIVMPLLFNVGASRWMLRTNGTLTVSLDARRGSFLPVGPTNEQVRTARYVHSRYARTAPSSLPVRASLGGLRAGTLLSSPSSGCESSTIRNTMVPHPLRLPFSSPTRSPYL